MPQIERELAEQGVQGVQAVASAQVAEMEVAAHGAAAAPAGQAAGPQGSCAWDDERGECRADHEEL